MLPMVSYEMIRQRNEERRARSLRRFWWRYGKGEAVPEPAGGADVIEIAFGTRCDLEEPVGA
ncbi:MAG TPA: hypothetical protein VLA91_06340 [Acidimicrobiia bacterium]|nr:hypothetical protein [Acidimicrobiia bacterium]